MSNKRTPTNYAFSRKQKRYIAKRNMKKDGKKSFCKHSYENLGGNEVTRIPSFFAENWRDFIVVKES